MSLKSTAAGKRALIAMHLSVLLWGLTGVLGRGINLSEGYLVWYRIMIASVTLGIYAVLRKPFVLPSKRDWIKMTGIGVLLTVHWLFFYGSIKYSNISITLSMLASQALFTVFFEYLILRKPIAKSEIVFSLMAMAGIWIIFYSEQIFLTGIILAIIASGVGPLFNILNKPILETNEPVMVSLIEIGTGFLFLTCVLPFYTSFFGIEKVFPNSTDWMLLFILAFFCTHRSSARKPRSRFRKRWGRDIIMAFDHVVALPSSLEQVRDASKRTSLWARRCVSAKRRTDQSLFGIVQGGLDQGLRVESARDLVSVGFDGYAVGGLSVGEDKADMYAMLDVTVPELPSNKPRYLMGVGMPEDLVEGVAITRDRYVRLRRSLSSRPNRLVVHVVRESCDQAAPLCPG